MLYSCLKESKGVIVLSPFPCFPETVIPPLSQQNFNCPNLFFCSGPLNARIVAAPIV